MLTPSSDPRNPSRNVGIRVVCERGWTRSSRSVQQQKKGRHAVKMIQYNKTRLPTDIRGDRRSTMFVVIRRQCYCAKLVQSKSGSAHCGHWGAIIVRSLSWVYTGFVRIDGSLMYNRPAIYVGEYPQSIASKSYLKLFQLSHIVRLSQMLTYFFRLVMNKIASANLLYWM